MTWPTSVGWVGVVLLCFGCGEEMSCGVVNCVEGASGELWCGDSCRRSCYWIVLGVDLGGGIEYSNEIQQRRMVLWHPHRFLGLKVMGDGEEFLGNNFLQQKPSEMMCDSCLQLEREIYDCEVRLATVRRQWISRASYTCGCIDALATDKLEQFHVQASGYIPHKP